MRLARQHGCSLPPAVARTHSGLATDHATWLMGPSPRYTK